MVKDNHGRTIDYLRLAITDRCNLRCSYCMPAEGLSWLTRDELLSFEEIERLLAICSSLGIRKVRFTGGEPFVRKDFDKLLKKVAQSNLFEFISITTNGVLTAPHIPLLQSIGIDSVNLSLDSTNRERFLAITRRDEFDAVMQTLDGLLAAGIPTKINAVIMEGLNEEELIPLAMLSKASPVDVRFIEEMPFNGKGGRHAMKYTRSGLLDALQAHFGPLQKREGAPHSTSENYHIHGHQGNVGIIAAWSRTFCGSCNRLRLTPSGQFKTCLYGKNDLDIKHLMRSGLDDRELAEAIASCVMHKPLDGLQAEALRSPVEESMATIGG
ncbi:MAG: GTP 3',8-cyclase MoaA [Flavobacteriales bacterium]|jgi:molybdenum cofactor biosynthesis protein A